MSRLRILNFLFLIFFSQAMLAQQEGFMIKGRVLSGKDSTALIGATIYEVNSDKGTIVDKQGNFTLQVTGSYAELRISAVGHQPYSKTVTLEDPNLGTLYLKAIPLKEVTIEAIRADKKTPVTQTMVEKEEIEEEFYGQDATDILARTPNVIMRWDAGLPMSNYSYIRMRGIDAQRINMTLNGVPLNDALDHGVFFSNFTGFMNSIESVQIQRGVGTSTNGQASYAGSINFESMDIRDTAPSGQLQITGGSYNTLRGSAEAKTGLMENNTAFYAKVGQMRTDGYRYHSGTQGTNGFFSGGWYGKDVHVKATAFMGRTQNELAFLPEEVGALERDPRTNSVSPSSTDDFGQDSYQLQVTAFLSDQLSISGTGYFNYAGGEFEIDGAQDGSFLLSLYNHQPGAFGILTYQTDKYKLDLGAHANRFYRENSASFLPEDANVLYKNNMIKDEMAGFAKFQGSLEVADLELIPYADLQVRYTGFDYDSAETASFAGEIQRANWVFLNPKIGARLLSQKGWSTYFSLGRASREPTRRDLLVGLDNITPENVDTTGSFDALDPETVVDLEFGAEYAQDWINAKLNFFAMEFRDEIVPTGILTSWGEQLRRNVESSFRRGVEFHLNAKPIDQLRINWNANGNWAKIREYTNQATGETFEDVKPLMTPDFTTLLEVDYMLPYKFYVGLGGRYVSEMMMGNDGNDDFVVPEYFLLNGQLGYNGKRLRVDFKANNLLRNRVFSNVSLLEDFGAFDRTYYSYGTSYGGIGRFYLPGAPTNFLLTTTLKF